MVVIQRDPADIQMFLFLLKHFCVQFSQYHANANANAKANANAHSASSLPLKQSRKNAVSQMKPPKTLISGLLMYVCAPLEAD